MRFTTTALGLAAKLVVAHPTAFLETRDPMPFGDYLWECKDAAEVDFGDCEPVREMIKDKGADNDGYYTAPNEECEAFESGNCRLTLCPQEDDVEYFMPEVADSLLHLVAAMCGLHGHRGWVSPVNGTYNLWLSESGWTGHN